MAWNVGRIGEAELAGREVGIALALPVTMIVLMLAKLAWERGRLVRGEFGFDEAALERTRLLLGRALASPHRTRRALALAFGVVMPAFCAGLSFVRGADLVVAGALLLGLLGCVAGEIAERDLFFRSEAMRGMPGASAAFAKVGRPA